MVRLQQNVVSTNNLITAFDYTISGRLAPWAPYDAKSMVENSFDDRMGSQYHLEIFSDRFIPTGWKIWTLMITWAMTTRLSYISQYDYM